MTKQLRKGDRQGMSNVSKNNDDKMKVKKWLT